MYYACRSDTNPVVIHVSDGGATVRTLRLSFRTIAVAAAVLIAGCGTHNGMWVANDGRAQEPDRDEDGVIDRRDACPQTPLGVTVDARGCEPDSDRDGVPDRHDQCPGTPPGTPVNDVGCPVFVDGDGDGDGVPDSRDMCPTTPRGVAVDARGCARDSDNDGVHDGLDRCPDTPRGVEVDAHGCGRDSDGDSVPDYRDACPDTPRGLAVDEFGCSLEQALNRLGAVHFDSDKATLRPDAEAVLREAARMIRAHPGTPVMIEGHTDDRNSDSYNLALSQRRAQAVVDFLVAEGVERIRLRALGRGETSPTSDNASPDGRFANRRVEFHVEGQ